MKMKELFDRGEFVVSAEVGPPKGIHVDELVEEAKTYLKDVHAVNVTDNQSSVMRLGSETVSLWSLIFSALQCWALTTSFASQVTIQRWVTTHRQNLYSTLTPYPFFTQ